ncbi:MAG: phospholipase D family protein, partial [Saezia sp.]
FYMKVQKISKRRRRLRMLWIGIVVFIIASFLSVYSYGVFAARVKGGIGFALPVEVDGTKLDRIIEPYTREHPGQTGLMMLKNNLDAFMARAITAREAQRSLDLQYYLWHDDLTGHLLDLEVLNAADRGVRVRIILDDMTAHGRESALAALDLHENIEIRLFNPTRARENKLRRGVEMLLRLMNANRRMHNKAWIADNRVAVVGGRNIGDEYVDAASRTNFFDLDMMLTGAAVADASVIFDDFWNSDAVIPMEALFQLKPQALEKFREAAQKNYEGMLAQPYVRHIRETPTVTDLYAKGLPVYWSAGVRVISDPASKGLNRDEDKWLIHDLYPQWGGATREFKIMSAYFVPGVEGTRGLTDLVAKGVDVEVLTNSLAATDVISSHSGYMPYREELFNAGVMLYELKPFAEHKQSILGSSGASLHTKAYMVDGHTGFIGSFNFDQRSMNLNTEMGVVFHDPRVIQELSDEFDVLSGPQYSYQLKRSEKNNEMIWVDYPDQRGEIYREWESEPETGWFKRMMVYVLSWLPIEWLL